jgi:uncharacterized protein
VPAVAGLKKQGANNGASLAFLISTPETGVDSIALTYALLGPFFAVVRPIAAFCTALAAGLMENLMGKSHLQTVSSCSDPPITNASCGCKSLDSLEYEHASSPGLVAGFRFAFNDLIADLTVWFIIGTLLAGFITSLVPDSFFSGLIEPGIVSYCGMLLASVPLYVCATMSTPLAAALIAKGISPGTALVLLLAGPATNMATISLVGKILGKRPLVVYLVSIIGCTIVFASVVDALSSTVLGSIPVLAFQETGGIVPEWVELLAGLVLAMLMIRVILLNGFFSLFRKAFSPMRVPLLPESEATASAPKTPGGT